MCVSLYVGISVPTPSGTNYNGGVKTGGIQFDVLVRFIPGSHFYKRLSTLMAVQAFSFGSMRRLVVFKLLKIRH